MDLNRWRLKKTILSAPLLDVSFYLAIVCQLLFIVVSLVDWNRGIPYKSLFSASFHDVFIQHEYYRLFTAVFAHASWDHVLGNAIFFVPFAALLTNYFGLIVFPLLTLVAGALINLCVVMIYPPEASVLGVSGVIYFMVAFWLVLYIGIERGLTLRQKIIRTLGLALVEFMPEKFDSNISYLSHGLGFTLGIIFGIGYFYFFRADFRSFEVWKLIEPELPEIESVDPEEFLLDRLDENSIQH